ncbi:response regulator [Synergistaceae bacterium OttesenSCG-928-I11]|nr:response regulator [Synergistaceae bacterium OttesenSCG-928-I11]
MNDEIRLLIVDDEPNTLDGLQTAVDWHTLGIGRVASANNGKAALDLVETFVPHIILTDISMPVMDGIELSHKVAKHYPACKIVFITGYCEIDYLKTAFKNGVLDYLLKPIDLEELYTTMGRIISSVKKEASDSVYRTRLEEAMRVNLPVMRNHFFNLVLDGRLYDRGQIQAKINDLSLLLPLEALYSVFCLKLGDPLPDRIDAGFSDGLVELGLIELALEITSREHVAHCFRKTDEIYILLVKFPDHAGDLDERMDHIARTLISSCNEQLGMNLTIGLGEWVESFERIRFSYWRALQAVKQSYFTGKNQIIYLDKSTAYKTPDDYVGLGECNIVAEYIHKGDQSSAIREIERIFSRIGAYHHGESMLALSVCLQLLMVINRLILESSGSTADDVKYFATLMRETVEATTLDRVKEMVLAHCATAGERLRLERTKKSEVVDNIKILLKEKFASPLTIETIAKHVFLSPAYICLLFKQETGCTINQYLTDLRLSHAIKLIADPDRKLIDICMDVGYTDPKYFTKLFKKREGLTPSEYRARLTEKE